MSGLCVVVGNGEEVDVSTDPTGGVSAWSARKISHTDSTDVSCPSNRLCVAVAYRGNVLASAHPLGAASTWHRTLLTSSAYDLQSVSCPTVSFCVASGYHDGESIYGDVSVSHHPTGGRRAWSTFRLHTHEATGLGVSCPSPKLCVAEGGAEFLTSTNPAGGPVAWRDTYLGGQGQPGSASGGPLDLVALSCASTRLCVAIDISGYVFTSIEPTAGARAWVRTSIATPFKHGFQLTAISCVPGLCVALDDVGEAYVSTDPAAPAVQAARPRLSGASLSGVAADRPRLAFSVGAGIPPGRSLRSIAIDPPPGIALAHSRQALRRGLAVKDSKGRRLSFTVRLGRGGMLTLALAHPAPRVQITISGAAIRASGAIGGAVRQGKAGTLSFVVGITDAGHAQTTLSLRVKPS